MIKATLPGDPIEIVTNLDDVRACLASAMTATADAPPGEHALGSLYAVASYTRSMVAEIERLRRRVAELSGEEHGAPADTSP